MREFHGKHEGDYVVIEDLDLRGTVTGDLTVMAEAELQLHGRVCGNLVVQKDGRAVVRGTVVGVVTNTGGDVEIFGTGSCKIDSAMRTSVPDSPSSQHRWAACLSSPISVVRNL